MSISSQLPNDECLLEAEPEYVIVECCKNDFLECTLTILQVSKQSQGSTISFSDKAT